jgi:hypothetical protein
MTTLPCLPLRLEIYDPAGFGHAQVFDLTVSREMRGVIAPLPYFVVVFLFIFLIQTIRRFAEEQTIASSGPDRRFVED